jgi:murein DD-endopeptidase MepM/ murein hydrolase activator NlpD
LAPPSVQPAAASSVSPWVAAHVRNEHLTANSLRTATSRSAAPLYREPSLSALRARQQAIMAGAPGRASLTTTTSNASIQFLTRPYTTWHNITSVFDHCNPDYTTDGRVCAFDGSVGLKSYGVDPGFSLGYAQSPGGRDYLYYDGHNGWDYALAYENVLASADGVVQLAGSDSINPCFGQTIIVDHQNGFSTRYAHLSKIYVSPGQSVNRGTVIAQSGNTGCSSGPHLHYGVYITSGWTAVDPWGWSGAAGADPWPSDPGNLWLTGYAQFPLPYAPTDVSAIAGNGSARLRWTAPSFSGGIAITSYTITSSPGGLTATVAGSQTWAIVTGLTNGTSYIFNVTASNSVGASQSGGSNTVIPSGWLGQYRPVAPTRILDTRTANGVPSAAPLTAGGVLNVEVVGRGGVPTSNVAAVILNVTVTNATMPSYLNIHATGQAPSATSMLNFGANETVANLVQVPVGYGGEVTALTGAGSVNVIFDVAGYYTGDTSSGAGAFRALTPSRILDTRAGTGGFTAPVGAGQSIDLQVTGQGGVPATGVSGVVLNVAVTNPSLAGFVTVFPTGTATPLASNINFGAGQTLANRAIIGVGTGGKVTIFNGIGRTDVIVDVTGWFTDASATADGSGQYHGLTPARVVDSRFGTGGLSRPVGPDQGVGVTLAGAGGVPAMSASVAPTAVISNVTVTGSSGIGYLVVYPSGSPLPLASDLNYVRLDNHANHVVAKLGADGRVTVYSGWASTDIIVDVLGWFN